MMHASFNFLIVTHQSNSVHLLELGIEYIYSKDINRNFHCSRPWRRQAFVIQCYGSRCVGIYRYEEM